MIDLVLDHLYLIVTGAGTARRVPGILPQLAQLGPRLVVIPTPNAARVVSVREMLLALPAGSPHRVVESYFDEAILPSPPFGLVVVAPCSFNSLNKLAAMTSQPQPRPTAIAKSRPRMWSRRITVHSRVAVAPAATP